MVRPHYRQRRRAPRRYEALLRVLQRLTAQRDPKA